MSLPEGNWNGCWGTIEIKLKDGDFCKVYAECPTYSDNKVDYKLETNDKHDLSVGDYSKSGPLQVTLTMNYWSEKFWEY